MVFNGLYKTVVHLHRVREIRINCYDTAQNSLCGSGLRAGGPTGRREHGAQLS